MVLTNKKSCRPVSRVLLGACKCSLPYERTSPFLSFIWPYRYRQGLSSLPPGIGRAILNPENPGAPVYVALQPAGFTCLNDVATVGGEHLPHLFTLIPKTPERSGFCGTFRSTGFCPAPLPFRQCAALCCPDFPPRPDRPERQNGRQLLIYPTQQRLKWFFYFH